MKVDIKKQLETRSFRVKGIDVHPTEPLLVTSLFTGTVQIWNYETQQLVRSLDVSKSPVRAVRFVARKNWIVVGGDDMQIRVYNASTLERVAQFEAHLDYIRYIVVHPTLSVLLSTGDDMVVKMWDWDQNWRCTQTFKGHNSYVLGLAINPKDPTQFASGSMDRTVKVWSMDSPIPNYTLVAHEERGVNFVEYYPFADKPYLLTTSDDKTVRIFDYQSKQVIATLSGHTHNVSFAVWHPELPLIVSGSEDSSVKLWNARSYKLEHTLNYGMERAWCVATKPNSNLIVAGFETGALALRLGRDEPVVSMDHSGKLVWARHLEAFSSAVKGSAAEDGPMHLQMKDLGAVEMQPSLISHSPDGRYVAVAGDNDVIVCTALAWRSKFFSSGIDFCWGPDNSCAILENNGVIHVKRNFKDALEISVRGAVRIFAGEFLAVATEDAVAFFDWTSGTQIAIISVSVRSISWADEGNFVALITDDVTHVLQVDLQRIEAGVEAGESELEEAFSEICELSREPTRSATWIGDCLVYTTASNRLNYLVGTESHNITHYDHDMYVLRYLTRDSAIYLCDKDIKVYSQQLSVAVVEFQTAVLRGDIDEAATSILPRVPESDLNSIARFLEAQGLRELALSATRDDAHKFDLALSLDKLDLAAQIAGPEELSKWRQLGDHYLAKWNVDVATECYTKAKELDTLLLIHTSTGNKAALTELAKQAEAEGKTNLAFSALWAVGDTAAVTSLLNKSGRHSEASLFALTYGVPIDDSIAQWKEYLVNNGRGKIADMLEIPKSEVHPLAYLTAESANPAETVNVDIKPELKESESKLEPEAVAKVEKVEAEKVEVSLVGEETKPTDTPKKSKKGKKKSAE